MDLLPGIWYHAYSLPLNIFYYFLQCLFCIVFRKRSTENSLLHLQHYIVLLFAWNAFHFNFQIVELYTCVGNAGQKILVSEKGYLISRLRLVLWILWVIVIVSELLWWQMTTRDVYHLMERRQNPIASRLNSQELLMTDIMTTLSRTHHRPLIRTPRSLPGWANDSH